MLFAKESKDYVYLPVLLVILFLSIESIIVVLSEFVLISITKVNSNLIPYSDEFLVIIITILAKGIGIALLIILINKKMKINPFKEKTDFNFPTFILITFLIYLGVIYFLIENTRNTIFIFSAGTESYTLWPRIVLSRVFINNIYHQVLLIVLLLVIIPFFEELLYRKAIIQALMYRKFGSGWIIIISSLIYAIPTLISNIVIYLEEQTFWNLIILLTSGFFLSSVFLKTQNIKYPVLMRILLNFTFYLQFLSEFNVTFAQFRDYFIILLIILSLIGIFLFFFIIFDLIATLSKSPSSLPSWMDLFLDYHFSEEALIKKLFLIIIILLPIVPLGLLIFIDHTVTYDNYEASLVKTAVKSIILIVFTLFCVIQIKSNKSLFEFCSESRYSSKSILKDYYCNIRKNYRIMIKETPRIITRHFGIILLILGVISPIFFFSMNATVLTSASLFLEVTIIEVTLNVTTGQNPFLSYSRVSMSSRSNYFWMLGIIKTTEEVFYLFKHSNGQWLFLPDTFMSHPGDWVHGLLTVGTWFLFLILLFLAIREYFNNHKIIAGFLVIGVIATEILWYLFTLGLGSIPAETDPPAPSTNQTLSQFFRMDFELNNLFVLPIGLIILGLVVIIFLLAGTRNHLQRIQIKNADQLENENSKDSKKPSATVKEKKVLFSEETK